MLEQVGLLELIERGKYVDGFWEFAANWPFAAKCYAAAKV